MRNLTSILVLISLVASCDPVGTSFVTNSSNDSLFIRIHWLKQKTEQPFNNPSCKEVYDTIYMYTSTRLPKLELETLFDVFSATQTIQIGDTISEIVIPPRYTAITNHGMMATRMFAYCEVENIEFIQGNKRDTIRNIESNSCNDIDNFLERNHVKNKRRIKFMWVQEIYTIKDIVR